MILLEAQHTNGWDALIAVSGFALAAWFLWLVATK